MLPCILQQLELRHWLADSSSSAVRGSLWCPWFLIEPDALEDFFRHTDPPWLSGQLMMPQDP
jgi:hypothetical protein